MSRSTSPTGRACSPRWRPCSPGGREGCGEPRGGAPVGREGSGEPRGGAPVGREGSGEPRGGAPVNRVGRRPAWPGLIERYRDRLPVGPGTPVVTLLEGGTPLVPAPVLSARTGCDVWLKVEGANPTGSFKDRGMTVAISKAAEEGARAVICASTGNTSASAAAYAVRAGMVCAVLVPQGKIALAKMAQGLVHGAKLLQVDGNFDDCLELARKLA